MVKMVNFISILPQFKKVWGVNKIPPPKKNPNNNDRDTAQGYKSQLEELKLQQFK